MSAAVNLVAVAALIAIVASVPARADTPAPAPENIAAQMAKTIDLPPPLMAAKVAEQQFQMLDANRDGKVTFEEFVAPMRLGFELMDENKDGVVSQAEMARYIEKNMAPMQAQQRR